MRGWSIPLGRWFGIEIRIHTFFLMLAILCLLYANAVNVNAGAGIALWILVLAAVALRECARLIVAAWLGLRLRAILLLPIGGLFAYANPESQDQAATGRGRYALALAGPVANIITALVLAAGARGASGSLNLLALDRKSTRLNSSH